MLYFRSVLLLWLPVAANTKQWKKSLFSEENQYLLKEDQAKDKVEIFIEICGGEEKKTMTEKE